MVRQYRYPIGRETLEFPAGGLELGEEPLAAAQRELHEETSYEAEDWEYLGEIYESISVSRHRGHLFVARNLRKTDSHKMAEDGISQFEAVSFKDIQALIGNNTIFDALTPAVFYKVLQHLSRLPIGN